MTILLENQGWKSLTINKFWWCTLFFMLHLQIIKNFWYPYEKYVCVLYITTKIRKIITYISFYISKLLVSHIFVISEDLYIYIIKKFNWYPLTRHKEKIETLIKDLILDTIQMKFSKPSYTSSNMATLLCPATLSHFNNLAKQAQRRKLTLNNLGHRVRFCLKNIFNKIIYNWAVILIIGLKMVPFILRNFWE